MNRTDIILFFLTVSIALFVVGLFADREVMKLSSVGIIVSTISSFLISWVQPTFLSKKSVLMNFAIATSYAFVALMMFLGAVFVTDLFIAKIQNITFAIFSSVFISMIIARVYIANAVNNYIG